MNKKCVIDTETNGVDLLEAIAVEISIVPLTDNFEIDTNIKPLSTLINPGEDALDFPKAQEALAFNKIGKDTILKDGYPYDDFGGFLQGWMYANDISVIVPLAHNWVFDRIVMCRLLGTDMVEKLIFRRAMDSHTLAIAINDQYELFGKPKPFKQTRLTALAEQFGIKADGAHRAEFDCIMTAQVYKKLLEFPHARDS
jgi:DNA polymerase III epsilon subunit-like protein